MRKTRRRSSAKTCRATGFQSVDNDKDRGDRGKIPTRIVATAQPGKYRLRSVVFFRAENHFLEVDGVALEFSAKGSSLAAGAGVVAIADDAASFSKRVWTRLLAPA